MTGERPLSEEARQETSKSVKASWFHGYMYGNQLFPQISREGVGIMVASAVLTDPPTDWNSFFKSRLSDNQARKLGNALDGFHEQAGVAYRMQQPDAGDLSPWQKLRTYVKRDDPHEIKPKRIQQQWAVSEDMFARFALGFKDGYDRHYADNRSIGKHEREEVEAFFTNPLFAPIVSEFKAVIADASQALQNDDGIALSDRYKEQLVSGSEDELRQTRSEIREHITGAIRANRPNQKMNWLFRENY